jgi:hypothetical protein
LSKKYIIYVHCRKILNLFVRVLETGRKACLVRNEYILILDLTTMYVDCVYPTMSKSTKQVLNHLKIAEESVVIIVFNHVICEVHPYTVTVSYCHSTWIMRQNRYQENTNTLPLTFMAWYMHFNFKKVVEDGVKLNLRV